jgi:Zn ribbon nucleic-acid-binding protein
MWDWLNCVVLLRHEYGIWCEDGAVFLRCVRCGHRSHGWDVETRGEPGRAKAAAIQTGHRRFPILGRQKA